MLAIIIFAKLSMLFEQRIYNVNEIKAHYWDNNENFVTLNEIFLGYRPYFKRLEINKEILNYTRELNPVL